MSCSRMHHHACRFIDHDQIFILEHDIERNVLSHQVCWHRWRDSNRYTESTLQGLTGLASGTTIHVHKTICDQPLNARTRKLLQLPDQKFIEPLRSLLVETKIYD